MTCPKCRGAGRVPIVRMAEKAADEVLCKVCKGAGAIDPPAQKAEARAPVPVVAG